MGLAYLNLLLTLFNHPNAGRYASPMVWDSSSYIDSGTVSI